MFTFTVLLLPLAIVFYYVESDDKSCLLMIATGALVGSFVSVCKAFLSFSHRIVPYSFQENFSFFFLWEATVPALALFAVFFLLSRDTVKFKVNSFFPLEASFFAVYMPYMTIASPEAKTLFAVFVKPILFLAMVFGVSVFLKTMVDMQKFSLLHILMPIFSLGYLVVPPFIESVWIMNSGKNATALWGSLSVLYVFIPVAVSVFRVGFHNSSGKEAQ